MTSENIQENILLIYLVSFQFLILHHVCPISPKWDFFHLKVYFGNPVQHTPKHTLQNLAVYVEILPHNYSNTHYAGYYSKISLAGKQGGFGGQVKGSSSGPLCLSSVDPVTGELLSPCQLYVDLFHCYYHCY